MAGVNPSLRRTAASLLKGPRHKSVGYSSVKIVSPPLPLPLSTTVPIVAKAVGVSFTEGRRVMAGLSLSPFVLAVAFAMFVNSMQRYASNFRGASQNMPNLLYIYVVAGTTFGLGWLLYLGFSTHWYTPLLLLLIAFLFNSFVMPFLESSIPRIDIILSFAGFLGVPICGFLMIKVI
jgi:hypothetical protein